VRGWLAQQSAALRDAARRLASGPLGTLLNVLVIGVALSLPVGLYLVLSQLQELSRQISGDPQVSLFLGLDATPANIADVEQRLRAFSHVDRVRFIPRAEAFEGLKRTAGLSEVLDSLPRNPLPDAFVATVEGNRPEWLESLRAEASSWPKVEHVQLDSDWARRLHAALQVGRTLTLLLAVLLALALIAVTFNTIRLQILTRREEIEVSALIGATKPFIRRPFLYFGAIQGAAGGLTAWLVVTLAVWILNRDLANLAALYASGWRLQSGSAADAASLLALSTGLGWIGAWLSVSRHLRGPIRR
jgi:cell division transport system permease protein